MLRASVESPGAYSGKFGTLQPTESIGIFGLGGRLTDRTDEHCAILLLSEEWRERVLLLRLTVRPSFDHVVTNNDKEAITHPSLTPTRNIDRVADGTPTTECSAIFTESDFRECTLSLLPSLM